MQKEQENLEEEQEKEHDITDVGESGRGGGPHGGRAR
jgi:hypothetical protein